MQTITFRVDKQQGPNVQHKNFIQYPGTFYNGKEHKKEYIQCKTETLCHTAKPGTTLAVNYTSIKI